MDANGNGRTDEGEFRTLAELGIKHIGLQHPTGQTEQSGNVLDAPATVERTDGSTLDMSDVWFLTQKDPVNLDITGVLQADGITSANQLTLNIADLLNTPTDGAGHHVVHVRGDGNDQLTLGRLLADGTQDSDPWNAGETLLEDGVLWQSYSHGVDASLQVLVEHSMRVQVI